MGRGGKEWKTWRGKGRGRARGGGRKRKGRWKAKGMGRGNGEGKGRGRKRGGEGRGRNPHHTFISLVTSALRLAPMMFYPYAILLTLFK